MDVTMPPSFPMDEFRKFGLATIPFFPKLLSDADFADPLKRRAHCSASWQAVRYRYRLCSECNDEFKTLHATPSDRWAAGWGDEELTYKLERCIYTFFMGGLSVFDSFTYCLYFVGQTIEPPKFPDVANPRNITRRRTAKAFNAAFPQATITKLLEGLSSDVKFSVIDEFRNILGHRLSGRQNVRSSGTIHADGTHTTDFHEETWHVPGATEKLTFDAEMLQRPLNDIGDKLKTLTAAALEFAEAHTPATVAP